MASRVCTELNEIIAEGQIISAALDVILTSRFPATLLERVLRDRIRGRFGWPLIVFVILGHTAKMHLRNDCWQTVNPLTLHASGKGSDLSSLDRELIATFVSCSNTCYFCQTSHGAAAAHLAGGDAALIEAICRDYTAAPISLKSKALLAIAAAVLIDGKRVTAELVKAARQEGANDLEIHDTVLIAAAFCMYNRYVDGLGTWQPRDEQMYAEMGKRMAEEGYCTRPAEILDVQSA